MSLTTQEPLLNRASRDVKDHSCAATEGAEPLIDETQASREAVAERARLHDVLTQAPMAIGILEGSQYTCTFANPVCRALGGGRNLVGKPVFEVFPTLRGQGFDQTLDAVMASGQPFVGTELPAQISGKGQRVFFDVVCRPKRSPSGQVDGVLVYLTNVTERVQARKRLEGLEALVEALVEASDDYIAFSTPDGQTLHVNQAGRRMVGIDTLEEAGGKQLGQYFTPEPGAITLDGAAFATVAGRTWTGDTTVRHLKTGESIPVRQMAMGLLDHEGKVTRLATVTRDLRATKRQHAEERQRAEFERQRIGIVSHDLRNPLSGILLNAALLLRRNELSERSAKIVLRIQRSGQLATRMIRDLLDFTQARLGGGIAVYPKPIDLHVLTRETVDEVRASFPERDIQVDIEGEAQGSWDADRMSQVVTNLVANAVSYSPPDTRVSVRARTRSGGVELEVHNLGAPIAPSRLAGLFEPLQRPGPHRSSSARSVGLGLFIVRHIVHAHGGSVGVTSSADEGTTFTVALPLGPARSTAPLVLV